MRPLLLAGLLLTAAGCDYPFNEPPIGSSTVTVRGDIRLDLRGQGYYSPAGDQPPTWEINLTGRNTPTVRFMIVADAVRAGTYALPADAAARLELGDDALTVYTATSGTLTVDAATATRADGTFAFTAERAGRTVTVEGTFMAGTD